MTIRLPLLWFSVFILFAALLIQLARWQRTAETEKGLARVESAHIGTEHQKWLDKVSDAEAKQRRLEKRLLWRAPEMLLPELGKISDKVSLSLVGVEAPQKSRRGDYGFSPLQLTFSGDYNGFSTFLSVVERINPTVRIDEVRLYRRKRGNDTLWMSLTLALMHNTAERDKQELATNHSPMVAIKMPAIQRLSVERSPFALATHTRAPPYGAPKQPEYAPLPQLTGILWDDVNPIAIFDDGGKRLSVGVGEAIAGATVLSIQPQQVIVKRGRQRHELRLWKKQW